MRSTSLMAVLALIVMLATSAGCVRRMGDFTIASTKNVGFNPSPDRRGVEGKDCSTRILFIPISEIRVVIWRAIH